VNYWSHCDANLLIQNNKHVKEIIDLTEVSNEKLSKIKDPFLEEKIKITRGNCESISDYEWQA
jgi:hypothetical protein